MVVSLLSVSPASRYLRCFGREEEDSALEELSLEATGDSFSEEELPRYSVPSDTEPMALQVPRQQLEATDRVRDDTQKRISMYFVNNDFELVKILGLITPVCLLSSIFQVPDSTGIMYIGNLFSVTMIGTTDDRLRLR